MEKVKVKEIELLQSLKGGTYFAQLFNDQQIDAMCENIRNDFPIECGLKLFQCSSVATENVKLKKRLKSSQEREEAVAKDLLISANNYQDDSLEDLAERLIGHKKCLIIKLHSALPLSEEDRDALANLLME